MKLLVFGGSFNPVHVGHLILAEEALESLGADRCLFVPAAKPPHKELASGASDADRIDMLSAAIRDEPRFALETCEIERGGLSFTVDTLASIIEEYRPAEKPYLLLGDDLAPGFSSWKMPERIVSMARIVLAHRSSRIFPDFSWEHDRLDNRMIDISSSDIRARISRGISCRQALPPAVFGIIRERGLYGYFSAPENRCPGPGR